MSTNAPSAQRLLTHPVVYLGEVSPAPVQLEQGVLYNLSGLPILFVRPAATIPQETNQ